MDARDGYHDETHVYPVGYKTRWTNADKSAMFFSEIFAGDDEGDVPGPAFRVTRMLLPARPNESAPEESEPLVVVGRTSLEAWAKMACASNARPEPGDPAATTTRAYVSAGSADRFCLDDVATLAAVERDPFVDVSCAGYQYCEQRGTWFEESATRARRARRKRRAKFCGA